MDFFRRKSSVRIVAAVDIILTLAFLVFSTYKIVEGVLAKLLPKEGKEPINSFTLTMYMILWCGLFAIHVIPLCAAFALFRVTRKGREEVLEMILKCRTWLKSTVCLLVALSILFILFSWNSEVQSYIGAGLCVLNALIRLFFRCYVQPFYGTLSNNN